MQPEVTRVTQQSLALHESMELHEIINFKTICLAKSKMMHGLVFDQDLKALMPAYSILKRQARHCNR